MTENQRRAIYGIALAVIGLLVGYEIIHDDHRELWVALVTAILAAAPITALAHITPDPPPFTDAGLEILDPPPSPPLV